MLTVSPVLYFKLDETSGTTAVDSSSPKSNGTLTNGPVWTSGKVGGALQLDGTNDYVAVNNANELNPTAGITIAAWLLPDQWGSNRRILQKGDTDSQYRLTAETNLMKFDLKGVTNGTLTFTLPTAGTWTHVAATYDGATMKLYYNGVLVKQQAASGAIATTKNKLAVGTKIGTANAGDYFDGKLDEVRLYDRGLSAAEVTALVGTPPPSVKVETIDANASEEGVNGGLFTFSRATATNAPLTIKYTITGSATNGSDYTSNGAPIASSVVIAAGQTSVNVPISIIDDGNIEGTENIILTILAVPTYNIGSPDTATVTIVDNDTAAPAGPSLYLKFDEGTGTLADDSSGFNHSGILRNGPAWATGQISGGLNFDGVNDYVELTGTTSAQLNPTAAISVAAWIKPDAWNGNKRILQKGINDNQYRLTAEGGYLRFHVAGVTGGSIATALPPTGQWTHVAATYDGSKISIYINSYLVVQQSASGAINVTGDELSIGRKSGSFNSGDMFDGTLDDIRLYGRGLSLVEVQQIYNNSNLPTVNVTASQPNAAEQGQVAGQFQISRSGSTAQALSVNYTLTGTTVAGDYTGPTGTATFAQGSSFATVNITPVDDGTAEDNETVIMTLSPLATYNVGTVKTATVTIVDNDTGNRAPKPPIINEPLNEGELVSGFDVHMEIGLFDDSDAGQTRLNTDWEIWSTALTPELVWTAPAKTGTLDHHIHFGDGTFVGPQAGKSKLEPDTVYQLRVRQRDNSGTLNNTSAYSLRNFRTLPEETPTAAGWVAQQAGYRVEEVPFTFAVGEPDWRLPVNIVFVPQALRGPHPGDPLFYVTELYGTIRVVTNNYTVHTYADGLLNYNPTGPISGSGENGLTGLAIDPSNGDVYVTMLYDDLTDATSDKFPKITRFHSTDGGLTASSQTDILKLPGEPMAASHIISNITFAPDGYLYVHIGDGFDATKGQDLTSFRGKIIRLNKDGSPVTSNPFYQAADRGNDGLPDSEDYIYAYGYRNPFGGAWRDASGARPAQHFVVENGPSIDRFSMLVEGRNYLYDGSKTSIANYNIADDGFVGDWNPSPAPVNLTFIQQSNDLNYSGFPQDKWGHAFVALSGPTAATGPNFAKSIQEWILNDDGTRYVPQNGEPANPRELVSYEGAGLESIAGIAAGPDGLYFSTLYPDSGSPTNTGAKLYRVVYVGP